MIHALGYGLWAPVAHSCLGQEWQLKWWRNVCRSNRERTTMSPLYILSLFALTIASWPRDVYAMIPCSWSRTLTPCFS